MRSRLVTEGKAGKMGRPNRSRTRSPESTSTFRRSTSVASRYFPVMWRE